MDAYGKRGSFFEPASWREIRGVFIKRSLSGQAGDFRYHPLFYCWYDSRYHQKL